LPQANPFYQRERGETMDTMTAQSNEETLQGRLKKMTDQALASLCDSLERGKSDELRRYLEVMSRFPKYSLRNVFLIIAQMPAARRVMGYQAWKELGRQVKRNEKAIRIWAPMKPKKQDQRANRSESDRMTEGELRESIFFRPVCVFDVSQTEGTPLPELSEVSGDPGCYLSKLKQFASSRDIRLGYEDGLRAYGVSRCGEIILRLGLPPAVEFHVLAHEIAHELIHSKESRKELTKQQGETEAEAVAYVVSKSIGLNTGHSASDYIQLWNGDKETLTASLMTIQHTAAQITQAVLK